MPNRHTDRLTGKSARQPSAHMYVYKHTHTQRLLILLCYTHRKNSNDDDSYERFITCLSGLLAGRLTGWVWHYAGPIIVEQ